MDLHTFNLTFVLTSTKTHTAFKLDGWAFSVKKYFHSENTQA